MKLPAPGASLHSKSATRVHRVSKYNSEQSFIAETTDDRGVQQEKNPIALAESVINELRAEPSSKNARIPGQKEPGDIEIPNLTINSLGLAAIDRTDFQLFSGPASKRLTLHDLKKVDVDGSSYARLWDGKRSAEVHWGDRPDQRYLLYPMENKQWRGESSTPNDGAAATVLNHVRLANGAVQLRFEDGRSLEISRITGGKDVFSTGPRRSEQFYLHLTEKEPYAIVKSVDGSKFEKVQFSSSKTIEEARKHLLEQFEYRATDEHTLCKLQTDMMYLETVRLKEMESNFKKRGMSSLSARLSAEAEIEQTYKEAARIAEFRSFIKDSKEWSELPPARLATACAEQIIANAAHPTEIDQGRHPTCAAASLEVRTFSRYPGRAAKFICDLATSLHFRGRMRGTITDIDAESVKAHQDSRTLAPEDEQRGIASQIFQVGAFNLMYDLNDPDLSYRQEEISKAAEKGDHLYDRKGRYDNVPLNRDNWLMDAYEEIVGVHEEPWMVSQHWFRRIKGNERGLTVFNEKQLLKILEDTERKGNFPLSLTIDTRNESLPMVSRQRDGNKNGGQHAINAYGFIPGAKPKVEIDNQWGVDDDHLGANALQLDRVFDMMNDPTAFKVRFPWDKPQKWQLESKDRDVRIQY